MDIIWTIVLVYVAYRGYQWYQGIQAQVSGGKRPSEVPADDLDPPPTPQPGDEDDYIEYEEIKTD